MAELCVPGECVTTQCNS